MVTRHEIYSDSKRLVIPPTNRERYNYTPAYNEHLDAQKCSSSWQVLIVTELFNIVRECWFDTEEIICP